MRRVFDAWPILALLALQGCATEGLHDDIKDVGANVRGHLSWWNDSVPQVIDLPRVCSDSDPEFRIPLQDPEVFLRIRLEDSTAIFHDGRPSCRSPASTGDSLRLVVARNPIPRGSTDSVVLIGHLAMDSESVEAYSLGKEDTTFQYSDNLCDEHDWCLREGASILYRTGGRVIELKVKEQMHPEDSPWARSQKLSHSFLYLVTVPLDVFLSPAYLVGYVLLWWACKDGGCNPWH